MASAVTTKVWRRKKKERMSWMSKKKLLNLMKKSRMNASSSQQLSMESALAQILACSWLHLSNKFTNSSPNGIISNLTTFSTKWCQRSNVSPFSLEETSTAQSAQQSSQALVWSKWTHRWRMLAPALKHWPQKGKEWCWDLWKQIAKNIGNMDTRTIKMKKSIAWDVQHHKLIKLNCHTTSPATMITATDTTKSAQSMGPFLWSCNLVDTECMLFKKKIQHVKPVEKDNLMTCSSSSGSKIASWKSKCTVSSMVASFRELAGTCVLIDSECET